MTVCVAAICADGRAVVAAADRMISTTDDQTRRSKVHFVTEYVAAMISGDVALHTELLTELRALVSASAEDPSVLTVKNIANAYAMAFLDAKKRRAENQFLLPLGLDAASFVQNQKHMDEKIVSELTREIVNYPMNSCSAIFIGIDNSLGFGRAHIYTVDQGRVACHNDTGFAAIGVGTYQAEASLMFAGHTPQISFDAGVYLTLAAKKRAEVAPGVGKETDIAIASLADNSVVTLLPEVIDHLEEIYERAEQAHTRINEAAAGESHEYLETFRAPAIQSEPEISQRVELSGTPPRDEPTGEFVSGTLPAAQTETSSVQHDAGPRREEEGAGP